MSIRKKLEKHDNDYSMLEPFSSETPINSSIIIPAYNGAEIFSRALTALSKHPEINKYPDFFEVIIINDGSTEDIDSVVKNFKSPCQIKYFSFPNNRGRPYARNKGISLADKELLFFLDCDVVLSHDYFVNSWKIHNTGNNIVVAGLAENLKPEDSRLELLANGADISPDIKKDFRYFKDVSSYAKDSEQKEYRIMDETDWFKRFGKQRHIGFWTLPYMVVTHNLSVRKQQAIQVKGFDERFKGWGCEDTYFGAKLIVNGCYVIPLRTGGAFRVKHTPRIGTEEERKKQMFENMKLYEKLIDEDLPK